MTHYMVEFERPEAVVLDQSNIQKEQLRFQDLMAQGMLISVNINEDYSKFWLIFKARDRQELGEIIQTLSHCKNFPLSTHELKWNEY